MWLRRSLVQLMYLVIVLLGVSLIVFSFLHLAPGDPVELMMGQAGNVSQEEMERLRQQHGLDQPLPVQFARFVADVARGDLGVSLQHKRPVHEVILERLPATLELTAVALALALGVALPLSIVAAVRHRSTFDYAAMTLTLTGVSVPAFWLGILLILILGMTLEWLPVAGRIDEVVGLRRITGFYLLDSLLMLNGAAFVSAVQHLILPALALGAGTVAVTARIARTSLLEVLQQDFVLAARAKGLPETSVVLKHALKNALIPVISVVALEVGVLLGGNMIVETVFGYPGVGRLTVDAIHARDYPLVQGVVLLYATTYVLVNFAADGMYRWLNPRIAQ